MELTLDNYLRLQDYYSTDYIDYDKEIRLYGQSLPPIERRVASDVFYDYINRLGLSKRDIFFAIYKLNGRNIKDYKPLMFNKGFIDQVTDLAMQSVYQDMDTVYCGGKSEELYQMTEANGYIDFGTVIEMFRRLYAISENFYSTEEECFRYFKSIISKYPNLKRNQMYDDVQKTLINFFTNL